MTQDTTTTSTPTAAPLFGRLQVKWGWLLAFGIFSLLLGTIGLSMEVMMTIASVQIFGVLLLIGGGVQLVEGLKCGGWKGILWHLLIALLYIAAGAVCLYDPLGSSGILTLAIAGLLIGIGTVRIIMALQHRGAKGWVWVLVAGLLAIGLGVLVLVGWPASALWVIGLFVSIELIFNGWSLVFLAFAARAAGKADAERGDAGAKTA